MTKIEAAEITSDLWNWLADNPGEDKDSWPRFEELEPLKNFCSYCELHLRVSEGSFPHCGKCPINKAGYNCFDDNSLYRVWENALYSEPLDFKPIVNSARKIAKIAEEDLRKLRGEE